MSDLLTRCLAWMDERWDDDVALLWSVRRDRHLVRETSLYALGSLMRGDIPLATRALDAVLAQQFDAPGAPYDGTFRRAPEEGDPPDDAVMWIHFDPNWRQFIGTTFALICDRYGAEIGGSLERRLRASIARAVETEGDGRVSPSYANIALMKAWLDAWSGRTEALTFGAEVARRFHDDGGFLEYNSPTYYGIDLFALALWRSHDELATLGADVEAALWRDVAAFYHAGLRNVCGPYDRAYGMDMTAHATPLGLWIWSLVGTARAPFPDTSKRFSHPHDICFAPCIAAFDAAVPDDASRHLTDFAGERTLERTLAGDRVITAWLGDDAMIGGWAGPTSGIGWFQHHHATMHWRRPDGGVGWLRVHPESPVAAVASPGRLVVTPMTSDPVRFDVHPAPAIDGRRWTVDGIVLDVDAAEATPGASGSVLCTTDRRIALDVRR